MADRFYGAAQGAQLPVDVTEAASTTNAAVELRVNDSIYDDKLAVLLAVRAILSYLELQETNPIA
jgi:hypothetical protein